MWERSHRWSGLEEQVLGHSLKAFPKVELRGIPLSIRLSQLPKAPSQLRPIPNIPDPLSKSPHLPILPSSNSKMLSFWHPKSPKPNKSPSNDFLTTGGSAQSGQDGVVTYASRDRKKDVQFACHLPTGSRHAAQAQQIVGHIYTDTSPQMGLPRSGAAAAATDQQLLENGVKGRQGMFSSFHEKTMSKQQQQQQQQSPRHSRAARTYSAHVGDGDDNDNDKGSDIGPDDSISSIGRHAPSRYRAAADAGAEAVVRGSGFRKQSATRTTHYLEGNERQLFVSAPNASQEARLFDEVAAKANAAKDTTKVSTTTI